MGTNYYWYAQPPCAACGREHEPIHIGKSSAGWCFSLNVHPELGIHDLPDWKTRLLTEGTITRDEYGDDVPPATMLQIITERRREPRWHLPPYDYADWAEFHSRNHSEQGPHGLLRHTIDGRHCIKHGAGTWDCMIGEFS